MIILRGFFIKYHKLCISLAVFLTILGLAVFYFSKKNVLYLRTVSFKQLPGWEQADTRQSLKAFQMSCQSLMKKPADKSVGSQLIHLTVKDWFSVCQAALSVDVKSSQQASVFFQTWFEPVEFYKHKPVSGLFTGYYIATLHGRLTPTKKYHVPIYGLPKDMVTIDLNLFDKTLEKRERIGRLVDNRVEPFPVREDIDKGAIAKSTPVLAWVDSEVDRLFVEIEGSGVIYLDDGRRFFLNYAGKNGAPYTAVGHVLIQRGVMTKKNQSMQGIRRYFDAHPEQVAEIIRQNKSFVFFKAQPHELALGSDGVALTSGYSLAVDNKWIPMGVPIWLNTTRPDETTSHQTILQRLLIAQDVGGAIRGVVRGDVFWGEGEQAAAIAGKMNNRGHYWMLLPKQSVKQFPLALVVK